MYEYQQFVQSNDSLYDIMLELFNFLNSLFTPHVIVLLIFYTKSVFDDSIEYKNKVGSRYR